LHVTSLPGAWGVGEIGPHAVRWVRALAGMGVRYWQVLPLGPTGYGDSPYQGLSTFAANPLLISVDDLLRAGWLTTEDLGEFPATDPRRADYGTILPVRSALLARAADRFAAAPSADHRQFEAFCARHADWLPDFALFLSVKNEQSGRAWIEWPVPLAQREPAAMAEARRRLAREIQRVEILQFLFERQWAALRRVAARVGVRMVGDLPIYVADVWARRELFSLDRDGRPTVVAGVPPDYFSPTGQRWGNPLYRWDAHAAESYTWWTARVRRALDFADLIRFDHFRGLESYWEIPAEAPTAERGRWVAGPGDALLATLRDRLGGLPLIAEDLGLITEAVHALRDRFGLPGMEVLQFLVGELPRQPDRLDRIRRNSVVYTGTHDNDTARGWFEMLRRRDASDPERLAAVALLGECAEEAARRLVEVAWHTKARVAVAPLQDILGLGSEARMNVPGRPDGNWQWRFCWEDFPPEPRQWLRRLTAAAGRGSRA
jgi:4-alpha-glucanotransferase